MKVIPFGKFPSLEGLLNKQDGSADAVALSENGDANGGGGGYVISLSEDVPKIEGALAGNAAMSVRVAELTAVAEKVAAMEAEVRTMGTKLVDMEAKTVAAEAKVVAMTADAARKQAEIDRLNVELSDAIVKATNNKVAVGANGGIVPESTRDVKPPQAGGETYNGLTVLT